MTSPNHETPRVNEALSVEAGLLASKDFAEKEAWPTPDLTRLAYDYQLVQMDPETMPTRRRVAGVIVNRALAELAYRQRDSRRDVTDHLIDERCAHKQDGDGQ